MIENVTNKDFSVILKLDLKVLECHFCVLSMDHRTASGHLSNTQRHRMTIENVILDGHSETKTMSKLYCQG